MASKLKLSKSITNIEDSEYKSSGFLSVVLPKNLINIGDSAFTYN